MNSMTDQLVTERLILVRPHIDDCASLLAYRELNKRHLAVWEPLRADSFYTLAEVKLQLRAMAKQAASGTAVHWLIKQHGNSDVIGQCGLTNIVRGPFQACHLGFALSSEQQGKGLMSEALKAAIPHMFDGYGLHRIMANYQPDNRRSENLLQRLGFEKEGLAKSYLKINGRWVDHVLTSLINR